ncbi:Bsd2p [Sugiyamaella lignohabitans]|uniref:Bsd2p n=1 Tax=Sugiyamaella lignohabitans TaxID=796027 RepID=A0A161HKR2_9ASCO|nr:Bsd2p [Sugiyamaella lignohabitans]ANB12398.1 Bsd2p [Sugiyamaella lignohabitans]
MANQAYSRVPSGPPSYRSGSFSDDDGNANGRGETDRLVDAFDESDDDDVEGDDRNFSGRHQHQDHQHQRQNQRGNTGHGSEVLFDAEDGASTSETRQYEDFETGVVVTRNIRSGTSSPAPGEGDFDSSGSSSGNRSGVSTPVSPSRSTGGGFLSSFWPRGPRRASHNNDGVFANLTARTNGEEKPDDAEQEPPSYEEAAADATPPYWETTIMAPGLTDELFIEGLPVGSPVNFAWNMIVSSAFQFVGFFLTYLLHTSHAAKQGSRAGLGITLLQCGFYLQPEPLPGSNHGGNNNNINNPGEFEPSNPNDFGGTTTNIPGTVSESHHPVVATIASPPHNPGAAAGWISTLLMVVGSILILKSLADYIQARRMEIAIIRSNNASDTSSTPADETPAAATASESIV